MTKLFFDTKNYKIVSAGDIIQTMSDNFGQNNHFLSEALMNSFDEEAIEKLFFNLFSKQETLDAIRNKIARAEAEAFVKKCETYDIDEFQPITEISTRALLLIDDIIEQQEEKSEN